MRIANPIYDVVFKYLLDDEKVARLMLSALLGQEVLELEFRPTEVRQPVAHQDGTEWLVLRMDFSATVRLEDGRSKLVLIEIQKANNAWDVQRFRRYLGNNWTDLERLLAVFDQGHAFHADPHLLDILEENFPERYRAMLRRLLRASGEQDIRDGMDVEDDVVAAFQEQARKTAQAREAKDRVIEEKDKALEEKDQIIADLQRRLGRP